MRPSGTAGKNKSPNACVACCIKGVKWFPVLFILSVVIWSYYAYVIELCLTIITNPPQRIAYLIIYHILFIMFLWCYWKTVFSPIYVVPDQYKIPSNVMERLLTAESEEAQRRMLGSFAKDLPLLNRTLSGAIRFCDICQQIKPDRSHHCGVCGVCVLKMDHHCPWVNNCVGYSNYKFFILFLGYGLIYCLFISLSTIEYFLLFWKAYGETATYGRIHVLFLFFVALMFAISLLSLFCYHCYLVTLNRTTLEAFRPVIFRSGPDKHGYYLGKCNNFKQVFGFDPKLWAIPIFTSQGDGVSYPMSADQQTQVARYAQQNSDLRSYESMGTTKSSVGDGMQYSGRAIEEDAESLLSTELWSSENGTDHNVRSALLPDEDE